MRTIKELLQLMLDNKQLFEIGLCFWNINLWSAKIISYEEKNLLRDYIKNNQPYNLHKIFVFDGYYWKQGNIKPRIKWLKKHILIN